MNTRFPGRAFLRAYALTLFGPAALLTAASITNLSPVIGHPGDEIKINGSGFDPTAANNVVQFGPNRAPVLAATATQLTVQVPSGQPLGPATVSVGGVNGPKFNTVASAKIASVPPSPPGQCGTCQCVACGCTDPNSSPCVTQAPYLGGGPAGSIYGDRGEFFQSVTDMAIPGTPGSSPAVGYALRRQYRSSADNNGALGNKWNTSSFERLQFEGDGSVIDVDGLGRYDRYLLNNVGSFVAPPESYTTLGHNSNGSYTLQFKDGTVKNFDTAGKLEEIEDRNGNTLSLTYNSQSQLTAVTDTLGRQIAYAYDGDGRLETVTDFIGRTVTYAYDANSNLISVTSPAVTGTPNGNDFPSGKTTLYTYDQNHHLLTVTRPNEVASGGPEALTNVYNSSGQVISQTYGGTNASTIPAGGTYTYTYTPINAGVTSDDPDLPVMTTQQTDPNGNVVQYDYNRLGYPVAKREYTHGIRPTDPAVYTTTMTYNADGRMTSTTLPAGNVITYQYDAGNPDRYQQGNMLSETRTPDPARGGDQTFITTTYTYEPVYNQIATMTEPRGNDPSYMPQNGGAQSAARYTTTYTYDAAGDLIELQRPTVTLPGGTSQTIETDYTYNAFGQMTSMTDPEGNVTQYQYCPAATPSCSTPSPSGGGYLQETITDAATSPRRTETTPPAHITTQYFYDGAGNVVRTIDGRGNDVLYTVNQLNQTVEMQSEAPFRYTTYTYYDANDNVVQRNQENQVPTATDDKPSFTSGGNFASADATPAFFVTRYTYDILDKLVTDDEDASGSAPSRDVTQYRYDADRNRIQTTQPAGNVTASVYDERNLLFTETRGAGSAQASTVTSNYDVNRNLATSVDGRGFVTTYQYDGFDRRATTIDAVGGRTVTHYDPAGNMVSQAKMGQPGGPSPSNNSATGNVLLRNRTSEYDELSRRYESNDLPLNGASFVASGVSTSRSVSETTGPLNPGAISTQVIYDRDGRVSQRIADDLTTTVTEYDGVSRPVLRTDPQGNSVQTFYDANSNVIRTVETDLSEKSGVASETITTTYQYDNRNRRTISSDNCGNTRQSAYDSRGNLTNTTDAKSDNTSGCPGIANAQGNTTRYTYDGRSRQLQSVQDLRTGGVGGGAVDTTNSLNPSGQVAITYVYDANSRMMSMTDNNSNATSYGYDALDRMTSETLADGTFTTYTFDADDDIVTVTDNNGTTQTNTYDGVDRLTQTAVVPAAGVIGTTANTYQYDGLNRPTLLTDNNDPTDPTSASTVAIAYDSLGRVVEETQNGHAVDGAWYAQAQRTGLTYPNGRQLNFTYDALERMATVRDQGAASNIAQYTYLGPQRVLQRQYQNGAQLTYLDNTGTTDIGYDPLRRTIERRDLASGNSLITGFTYSYDRENNKNYEEKLHQTGDSELYSYDSAYRLIQFQSGQLNLAGTAISGSPASTEAWTVDGVGNWRVDTVNGAPDNRTVNSVNEYSSINGGPLVYDSNGNLIDSGVTYQWDYRNRLREVCSGGTSCTSPGAEVLAVYSYDALNRRTRKVVGNSGPLNGTTNFYYDGWQTIEERDGTDTETQQYVYGIYLDEPLILDLSNGSRYFYHQNTLYSTYALTNSGGSVVEGYQYDAYGVPAVLSSNFSTVLGSVSTVGNPYMFTGQRLDPETGLMYFKNRYYSPTLGRFLSRDPKEDVDINLFSYVGDRPTAAVDPLGLWCQLIRKTNRVVVQGDCQGHVQFAVKDNLEQAVKDKIGVLVCREFFECASGGGSNCRMTSGPDANPTEGAVPRRIAARVPTGPDDDPPDDGNNWIEANCCCNCKPPANAANPAQPPMPQAGNGGGGGKPGGGGQGQGQGQGQGNKPNNQGQGQGNKPNNQGQGNNPGRGNGMQNNPRPVIPRPQPIPKKKK